MNKFSILMLMSKYHAVSGHTRVVDSLSIELKKLGHDVTLGSFDFKKELPPGISKLNLNYYNVSKEINQGKYDIIHNHQTMMNYFLLSTKKPIIFHYHGASTRLQKINLKISSLICKKKIRKIISISDAAKNEILEYFPTHSNSVIYNGVNNNFYKNKNKKFKKGNPQILFVGNLFQYKNIQFIIKNFFNLKKEFPGIHFQIIGEGNFKNKLYEMIKELNVESNIEFIGRVNDEELKNYYSSCDIYLSASLWEFFNLPLLEAMASGKPVLVSNLPVHQEIILKSNAGEIFEMNSTSLILKMKNILENYEKFSNNGLNFAHENDWSEITKKLTLVYHELIK